MSALLLLCECDFFSLSLASCTCLLFLLIDFSGNVSLHSKDFTSYVRGGILAGTVKHLILLCK